MDFPGELGKRGTYESDLGGCCSSCGVVSGCFGSLEAEKETSGAFAPIAPTAAGYWERSGSIEGILEKIR
jgi:hypothetical protein